MKKVTKNDSISELYEYGHTPITIHDVITGVIVMAIIVFTTILLMSWIEPKGERNIRDLNVKESYEHSNPPIP